MVESIGVALIGAGKGGRRLAALQAISAALQAQADGCACQTRE